MFVMVVGDCFYPERQRTDAASGADSSGFHTKNAWKCRDRLCIISILHTLSNWQSIIQVSKKCVVCKATVVAGLGYRCSQACDGFWIHMEYSEGFEDKDEKRPPLAHPSHPQHDLRFSKKTRRCPFPCGATEKGDSYICTLCDYWIHQSCALLPPSADFPHHHHSFSLAFPTPRQYILNRFDYGVCNTSTQLCH